jgi:hypothetical protein
MKRKLATTWNWHWKLIVTNFRAGHGKCGRIDVEDALNKKRKFPYWDRDRAATCI